MSENVSSKVLFHFTSSMTNLKGILKYGFFPRYCLEYTLDPSDRKAASKGHHPKRAVPMVCFCDLPLSLIRKHLLEYGHFGIGLRKSWGLKNGVAPVIYTHAKAQTRSPILGLSAEAAKPGDRANKWRLLAAYTKRFSGPSWRKGRVHRKVKFYDEREWRYVPTARKGVPPFLDWKDYSNASKRKKLHRHLAKENALQISPDDIQYLILPKDRTENSIIELHSYVTNHYRKHHSLRDAILVSTTIMTEDCIEEDT